MFWTAFSGLRGLKFGPKHREHPVAKIQTFSTLNVSRSREGTAPKKSLCSTPNILHLGKMNMIIYTF